jgi:MoaA/NifB/PqqE/SkfB family radical SAM enzyme
MLHRRDDRAVVDDSLTARSEKIGELVKSPCRLSQWKNLNSSRVADGVSMLARNFGIPFLGRYYRLIGRYRHFGGNAWVYDRIPGGDDAENRSRSALRLFEDGVPLFDAHHFHETVAKHGGGRYSHWGNELIFSATDNSNPNTNGRKYTYDFGLDLAACERSRAMREIALWQFHPRAEYFLARGGTEVPPPYQCNIGLTNKCNLRCEICGSQKFLDATGVRRRHMDLATFEAVAETLFPVLVMVELNSQGDPLLHPHITTVLQRIKEHCCDLKVQTNGTLFSDQTISLLVEHHGTVMLSLDAVGPKFDEVRSGGVWSKAEPGLKRFLAARDPRRMRVGIYPTLTKRTIGEALNVVRWAVENGVDLVDFHRYVPVQASWEQSPTADEYAALIEQLTRWAAENDDPLEIWYESKQLNSKTVPSRRTKVASPEKRACAVERDRPAFPLEADAGDPLYICTAPLTYVEIGLEGQIGACCRAQDIPLGYATSVEEFAAAWLGNNYDRIRTSLKRGETGQYPLPNCESCIKFFAPIAGGQRTAVDYEMESKSADALQFGDADVVMLEALQKEDGCCFIARIVPGLNAWAYSFYEDDRCLSAHPSLHDDIRKLGAGRYAINGRSLYFSTSDGTDARRNGRQYSLRRVQTNSADVNLRTILQNSGHCFIAGLTEQVEPNGVILLENDRTLGPTDCPHNDIRAHGAGRYSVWHKALYFSASDNSDPRVNGRRYRLQRISLSAAAERIRAEERSPPIHSLGALRDLV